MAIAGVAVEHVVGVAHIRVIGLHEVVTLGLLLTGLNLVDGTVFEGLALLLLLGQIVEIALIAVLRECEPVHHIA